MTWRWKIAFLHISDILDLNLQDENQIMTFLYQKIPAFLTQKRNTFRLIAFTALMALVFINIYAPFGVKTWYQTNEWELLVYSSFVIMTGVLMVAISRVIMYQVCRFMKLSYLQYFIWVAIEVILMALVYTFFDKYILGDDRFFFDAMINAIQNTALIIVVPYSILWLYFSWQDKTKKIIALSENKTVQLDNTSMVSFRDEKGQLRFSIKQNNLLYLKAADNYIFIYYRDKDKTGKFLLRNTLAKLDAELENENLIRCHRSYIVNLGAVKLLSRESDGMKLELEHDEGLLIPISKTYQFKVLQAFGK
jgi:LytTr DNA-binding domain-containing protein